MHWHGVHWLGLVLIAAVTYSIYILVRACLDHKKATEERRTHRRTWEK
ncbi:hypothetical protein LCGC14_1344260 [marine sediment metagenome]|uniref:Uncharacterized protein n=1 Tax=marine sediment metagenome TaxID=412755 RepID=A0A0F9KDF8_9ZZZZ